MRSSLYSLGLLAVFVSASSCHGRSRGTAASDLKGVGFELPGAAHVERGAIVTTPPGREEAFVAFVAGQAPAWVDACLAEVGGQTPVFGFETGDKGALAKPAVEPGQSARERCLSARAAASPAPGLPEKTTVRIQLALK